MSRRFLIRALAVLATGTLAFVGWEVYLTWDRSTGFTERDVIEMRKRMGGPAQVLPPAQALAPIPPNRPIRLAFGGLGLADDAQNRQLGDLAAAALTGAPGLELVERPALDKILSEMQLSLSGLVRAKDAVAAGKLLRADWFLLGTSTAIGGTNAVVLRLVDARTGIVRDAGAFGTGENLVALALNVAAFVRQCRANASSGKQPVYLAIGSFQDLGINNRQAEFPAQLRGYLVAAFQGGSVTVLEREYVETLLQEVYLDLAGLTQDSTGEPPAPMQSAFWMVTGSYQSYETANLEVELNLEVARIFGTIKHLQLRAAPGEPLDRQVKSAIDRVLSENSAAVIPTRQSEVRLQMAYGKELAGLDMPMRGPDLVHLGIAFNTVLDDERAARKRRNAEEALRAFQTVLLLDPTNREAKLCVAACLRNNTIQRVEEARHYYRELIESPVQDNWSGLARLALLASFDWRDTQAKALWLNSAAAGTSDTNAAAFYRHEAQAAETELLVKGTGVEAQAAAEARLWANITNALLGSVAGSMGVEEYVATFGTNRQAAAQRLAEMYPSLCARGPELAPYLLAAVATAQVDTNAPSVLGLQRLLENLTRNPDQVYRPYNFWLRVDHPVWNWSWRHTNYALAAALLEGRVAASAVHTLAASYTSHEPAIEISDRDRFRLAYAYVGTHEWDKALTNFLSFSNQPFSLFEEGPWGRGGTVISTSRAADYCRQKLGLATAAAGKTFKVGQAVMHLHSDRVFATDEHGLWIGLDGQLIQAGFDLKTNLVLNLPATNPGPVTAICSTPTNLWIGTDGDGLYQFDKPSGRFRHWGQTDGLLIDKIAALHASGDTLWIGYGRNVREAELKSAGGLGTLDLRMGQPASFMPSVLNASVPATDLGTRPPADAPTRGSVLAITDGAAGEIWFLAEEQSLRLCRYRTVDRAWEMGVYQACSCLARDDEALYVGQNWNYYGETKTGALGVRVLDLKHKDAEWRELQRPDELPPGRVTALAVDAGKLWVGGFGYIALLDPVTDEVRAVASVQAQTVDRLEIAGGCLWAQFAGHLYCVPLSQIQ